MKKLIDLETGEISLVPRGANKKKFLVLKSNKGDQTMNAELLKLIAGADPKMIKKIEEVLKGFQEGAPKEEPKKKPEEEAPAKPGLSERGQSAVKAIARIAHPFKDEEHFEKALHESLKAVGMNGGEAGGGEQPADVPADKATQSPEKVEDDKKDVIKDHMDEAQKAGVSAYKAHLEKLGYQKYPEAEMQMKQQNKNLSDEEEEGDAEPMDKANVKKGDDLLSALPKDIRPAVEAIFKSNKELVEKSEALEKDLKTERDLRVTKEFEAKVEKFKHVGADKAEMVKVLKALSEKDPENYEKIEKMLLAADAQIGKGDLFKEKGSSLSASGGSDAEAKIDAAVAQVVAKNDKITKEQAYTDFLATAEGQRLYGEVKASRKDGI